MTVRLRDEEVATLPEMSVTCREALRIGVETDELGAVWLGEFTHAPTLETECKALLSDGSVSDEARRVARRILDALGANETKADALRSRPHRFTDGPWEFETEPEFPLVGSPDRDHVRGMSRQRIGYWERALTDLLERFYERQMRVVLARLQGKQGRKGTRHWTYETKTGNPPQGFEIKAIDPEKVLDRTRWRAEIESDAESTLARIYERTATDTAEKLGGSVDADVVLSAPSVQDAIREKIKYLMASTDHRAEQVMKVILDADASGDDLDTIVDKVIGTYDQRRIWAQHPAHVLAASTINDAALKTALKLGVAYKQWLSSRDDRVRFSHRGSGGGDGQVVPIASPFVIGGVPLMFPGDPSGLPATGPQVYGCRCTMLFAKPAGEPLEWTPLEDLPGGPIPEYDPAPDRTRFQADLVTPRFQPSAAERHLAEWLGGIEAALEPEFRRRGWRATAVKWLRRLAAAWLVAQAVQAVGEMVELAGQIVQTLADAGVPQDLVQDVAERLQAERAEAQRTIEADEEATP